MFCQKCGKELPDGSVACNYCGAALSPSVDTLPSTDTKRAEVLKAKIATKQQQIESIGHWGPGILVVVGFLLCLTIYGIIIGVILIGIGIWWSNSRVNEVNRLRSEIKELEVELEP